MRDLSIDGLKGFAIFLVVLGHLLQGSVETFDHNLLFRIIYSFHMPLFFFLSGYIAFFSKDTGIRLLNRRFLSLIIPFFSWAVISYYIRNDSISNFIVYISEVVYAPDRGLWFLWILFFCYLLLYFSVKIPFKIEKTLILVSFGLILLGIFVSENIFGIKLLGKEFIFFCMGFIYNKNKAWLDPICKKSIIICYLIFIIGVNFWMRTEPPLFYKYVNLGSYFSFAYTFLIAFCGVTSCYAIFQYFKNKSFYKPLCFIGQQSLSIYAIHFFFLRYFNFLQFNSSNYYYLIILSTISLILLCLLINYLIMMNTLLSFLLLGKSKPLIKSNIIG